MKRNLFHTFAAVVAAAALIGCSADNDIEPQRPDQDWTLTLRTDGIIGDTRTEFDPAINQIKWSASDNAVFYSNGIGRISEISLVEGGKFAEFKLSGMRPDMLEDRTRSIQGFYPVEARWNDGHLRDENNQIKAFALNLKSRQEAPSTTFDPEADILVAENLQITLAESETEKNIADVRFGRPVAITEIKYVISNDVLKASDEKVRSITLHVEDQDQHKYLAGNFYFNPETFQYVSSQGNVLDTDNSYFFDSAHASSVQVMLSDTPAVKADFTAWVVTAPIALTAGDMLEFTIRTTAGTVITKTVTLQNSIAFSNTRRNTLTVKIDDTATVTTGSAEAITEGYYAIATDQYMMTADLINNKALDKMTLPTEYIDGKLVVNEDKAIWYIKQSADGSYTISSKLNGLFINTSEDAGNCTVQNTATPLKIQPANGTDAAGKYNISVNKEAGNILAYNASSPRFAFYAYTTTMAKNLQIIPVYVDNTPSFDLLKDEITVSAVGEYTEKDVYQLRNASAANILIDVDGTVVTSASIANAAVTFTVDKAEANINGWIDFDFNGEITRLNINITPASEVKKYVKITSAPADWSGVYLIVYEASATEGKVFNNIDDTAGCINAVIKDYTIESNADIDAEQVTIEQMTGGYAIKGKSGYMYGKSNDNKLFFNANTQQLNTIEYNSNSVKITSNTSVFRYNTTGRFRYYKSSSYTGQKAIQLYKLEN